MKYYAIYDGTRMMMLAEISEGKENELLRCLEVASMISEAPTYKEVTYEEFSILEDEDNEFN